MSIPNAIDHPAFIKAAKHHDDMVRQRNEVNAALAHAKRSPERRCRR